MTHHKGNPTSRECPPAPDNPACQPHPAGDGKDCCKLPETSPPHLDPPAPCPEPDPCCKCPQTPGGSSPNCLEKLIAKQAAEIVAADKAKAYKADLEKLLDSAKKASQAFTRDKYVELVTEWQRQDAAIAELLRKLACAVPCWDCILECYVCPLLNELHYAEKWLYNDGTLYTEVHDLYDLQYWHQRDKAAKQRRFDRIDSVMKAWSNPAKTIGDALGVNKGLTDGASKVIGTEPGKAIYDVFLRLVPMHLAIAPPATSETTTTKIDKKYTEFCECNQGKPDYCCGPDTGEWSLRRRLIGPQPYLIDPNDYFKLICCLVEHRYEPAKDALAKAEARLAAVGDQIARYEAQVTGDWSKNFETAARGAIPSVIDCCDYEPDEENAQKSARAF